MIEPISYLYYRCCKFYGKNNNHDPQSNMLFGIIVYINTTSLIAILQGSFPSKVILGCIFIASMILMLLFSYNQIKIVKKYDKINHKQRITGSIIFLVEILVTIMSFIILIRI